MRGEAPIASHLLYTQPGILHEPRKPTVEPTSICLAMGHSRRFDHVRDESGLPPIPDLLRDRNKLRSLMRSILEIFSLTRGGLLLKTEIGVGGCRHLPEGLIISSGDYGGAPGLVLSGV
jgi:hypothetical protein